MKRFTSNESGYALLLSFCVLLIFSILGLSLMTLTANGVTKNSNREDIILAQDLSDKGIDFVVGDIQEFLEKKIVAVPMGKTDFGILLDTTLNDLALKCPAESQAFPDTVGIKIPGENSNYTKVCVDSVNYIGGSPATTEEKDLYKRIVTFKSIGVVNDKEHVLKTDVIIGTDAIPDQLKYAVSSNKGGNLYFHGGVEVTGDVKTAGNIHMVKKSFMGWANNPTWYNSVALRLVPTTGNVTSKIIFENADSKLFYYNGNQFSNGKKIEYKNPTNSYKVSNQKEIRSLLTNSPKVNIISKEVPEDSINVKKNVEDVYKNSSYNLTIEGEKINGKNVNFNREIDSITYVYNKVCIQGKWSCSKYGSGSTEVTISGNKEIQGKYYIHGDLIINNANIKSNAVLYVDGNVNIRFSELAGLNDGTLIIFATGEIFIANISEHLDKPSIIKGFFYSERDMTLYGISSNIKIIGGISSNNLYLTSLRGNVKSNNYNVSEDTQIKADSRLTIIYDENIIKQFTKFKRDEEEEFITELNDPELINRY